MVLGGFPIGGGPIGGGGESGTSGTSYLFYPPPVTDPTTDFRADGPDIPEEEFGTYHSWLIPEPDSPLTIGWVECIGLGVARCMLGGRQESVLNEQGLDDQGYCSATVQLVGQNSFAKIPFVRVYQKEMGANGQAYYRDRMIGPWQNFDLVSDGRLYFLDRRDDRDTFAIQWGGHGVNFANTRGGTWVIVANGR